MTSTLWQAVQVVSVGIVLAALSGWYILAWQPVLQRAVSRFVASRWIAGSQAGGEDE